MNSSTPRILPINEESQKQLVSTTKVTSLNDVVVSLIENSLDAGATSIHAALNYARGTCTVDDNGTGIASQDFEDDGLLAQPYCTSKEGLKNVRGRHGNFLYNLSSVSIVRITSKASNDITVSAWINSSGRFAVHHDATNNDSSFTDGHGTKITVFGLFHSLPVRFKHNADQFSHNRKVREEFELLKHWTTTLMLGAQHLFSLDLNHETPQLRHVHRFDGGSDRIRRRENVIDRKHLIATALQEFGYLNDDDSSWEESTAVSRDLQAHLFMLSKPQIHDKAQFVYLDINPLDRIRHQEVFKAIMVVLEPWCRRFMNSQLGIESTAHERTRTQSVRHAGTSGQHPAYVLYLQQAHDSVHRDLQDASHLEHQTLLARITNLAHLMFTELIKTLLKRESFCHPGLQRPSQSAFSLELPDSGAEGDEPANSEEEDVVTLGDRVLPSDDKSMTVGPSENHRHTCFNEAEVEDYSLQLTDLPTRRDIDPGTIEWFDRLSGRLCTIDERTGVILPSPDSIKAGPHSASRRRDRLQALSLDDVIKTGSRHFTSPRTNSDSTSSRPHKLGHVDQLRSDFLIPHPHPVQFRHKNLFETQFRSNILDARVSKTGLKHARVIGQIDQKFILSLMPSSDDDLVTKLLLVIIDQHAADERCKVEHLIHATINDMTLALPKPIAFEISQQESRHLIAAQSYFRQWNVAYNISAGYESSSRSATGGHVGLKVTELPWTVAERCRNEPDVLFEMLSKTASLDQQHLDRDHVSGQARGAMPGQMLELLNSRACRSAIMFNDRLTRLECEMLIKNLVECTIPFQCAHGRPSMSVLSVFEGPCHNQVPRSTVHIQPDAIDGLNQINENIPFGQGYKRWIASTRT